MTLSLFTKSVNILLCINGKRSITKIAKATNITGSHVSKRVNQLSNAGLAEINIIGRDRIVSITPKGKEVRKCFCNILGGVANGYGK